MPRYTDLLIHSETATSAFCRSYPTVWQGRNAVRKLQKHGWEIVDYGGPVGAYVVIATKHNAEGV